MNVYIYCADIYCEQCGEVIRTGLDRAGFTPADPDDEYTYDSDKYPKGPYPDGGGKADCPQHCGGCGVFLENPLTTDGVEYVREAIQKGGEVAELWAEYYADYDVIDGLAEQMGLSPEQIAQAKAEGVTTALGLRRIEENSRGE